MRIFLFLLATLTILVGCASVPPSPAKKVTKVLVQKDPINIVAELDEPAKVAPGTMMVVALMGDKAHYVTDPNLVPSMVYLYPAVPLPDKPLGYWGMDSTNRVVIVADSMATWDDPLPMIAPAYQKATGSLCHPGYVIPLPDEHSITYKALYFYSMYGPTVDMQMWLKIKEQY